MLDELREKCPWDRKQTNESLRPQTIEEVYELNEAILNGDERELSKELGDVLLHVLFYAKIGEEKQTYDIVDVINFLCDKYEKYKSPLDFLRKNMPTSDLYFQIDTCEREREDQVETETSAKIEYIQRIAEENEKTEDFIEALYLG